MPLSARQKSVGLKMAKAAEKGDSKALQFFANIAASNPSLSKEYDDLRKDGDVKRDSVRRSDIKADTALLTGNQFRIACTLANAARENVGEALRFFAAQEELAKNGNSVAKVYLAVRDEVLLRETPVPVAGKVTTAVQPHAAPAAREPAQSPAPVAEVTYPPVVLGNVMEVPK